MGAAEPLDEGWTLLEEVAIRKVLDPEGRVTHGIAFSDNLLNVESLGMIDYAREYVIRMLFCEHGDSN